MPLIYFLLGILFSELLLPILKKFVEIVITWFEKYEAKLGEAINDSNLRIKKATLEFDNDKPIRPIGFSFDDCEDDIIEEEDEPDDV